jgi:hypothetical protein
MLAPSKASTTATERGLKAAATRAANKLRKEIAAGSAAKDGFRGMFKASGVKLEKADAATLIDQELGEEQDEHGTQSEHEEVPAGQPAPLSCVSTVAGMRTPEPRINPGASPTPSPAAEQTGSETPRHDVKDGRCFPNRSVEGAAAELHAMGFLGAGNVESLGLGAVSVIEQAKQLFDNGGFEKMEGYMANHVAQSARVGDASDVVEDRGGDIEALLMTEKESIFKQAGECASFDMKSKVGQWWTRELKDNQKLKADYIGLGKGYESQRKFRQEWAKTKFSVMMSQRTHTEQFVGERKMQGA